MNRKAEWLEAYKKGEISKENLFVLWKQSGDTLDFVPFSEKQKSLWVHSKISEDKSIYNVPIAFKVKGKMGAGLVKQSTESLLLKYPFLNSKIVLKDNVPGHQFISSTSLDFVTKDLVEESPDQVEAILNEMIEEEFDLERSLFKARLLQVENDEHIFIIVIHHIIFDGSSILPLVQNFFEILNSNIEGTSIKINPDHTYAHFAKWEKDYFESKRYTKDREYWSNYCQNLPQVPALKKNEGNAKSLNSKKTIHLQMDMILADKINRVQQKIGVSKSVFFLACYKILLSRYLNVNDITIGMPTWGRPEEGYDDTVGYFVNMLPVLSKNLLNQRFDSFTKELQDDFWSSMEHALYPIHHIIKDLKDLKTDQGDLFHFTFAFQNFYNSQELKNLKSVLNQNIRAEFIDHIQQRNVYPLGIEVYEMDSQYKVFLKFDTNAFSINNAKRLLENFKTTLHSIVENSSIENAEINIVHSKEKKKLVHEFGMSRDKGYSFVGVVERIQRYVLNNPDAIALKYKGESLSYRTLWEYSDNLANALKEKGVRIGSTVCVYLEKSIDSVCGILATLKCGAKYMSLDEHFPKDRLKYVLTNSKCQTIITTSKHSSEVGHLVDNVVLLENVSNKFHSPFEIVKVAPNDNAYIIYTSGSTGNPKGVMVKHLGLDHIIETFNNTYDSPVSVNDNCLSVANISFDVCVLEYFLALCSGATLVLMEQDKVYDYRQYEKIICDEKISWAYLPVNILNHLPNAFKKTGNSLGLQKLLVGVEPIHNSLLDKLIELNPKLEILNGYGPTETTVCSTLHKYRMGEIQDGIVPIGKPFGNSEVFVLNQNKILQPIGVPGELYIAGDGVSSGYVNEALNEGVFVKHFQNEEKMMYRTGDIVQWNEMGYLEFIGRKDSQVKLRGHRIELSEIENTLKEYKGIDELVVIIKEINGSKKLVAYYSCIHENIAGNLIKEFAESRLPQYMIPTICIALDNMPYNTNGKIDKKLLSAREVKKQRGPVQKKRDASKSSYKNTLLKIKEVWRKGLGLNHVSDNDAFTEIGGDSVSAVTISDELSNLFEVDISITSIYKYGNPQALAEYISADNNINDTAEERHQVGSSDSADLEMEVSNPNIQAKSDNNNYEGMFAIIGLSCKFPQSNDPFQFWDNLASAKECIKPPDRGSLEKLDNWDVLRDEENFVAIQTGIEGKELFDPDFFNLSMRDAEFMDPQFRQLLLHSWKAVEDAGYTPDKISNTAVYMSASGTPYHSFLPHALPDEYSVMDDTDKYVGWMMSQGGTIPTMISHRLGFKGPSYFVHSNCSSSLIGVYNAIQALKLKEVDQALVGGTTLFASNSLGYMHQPGLNFSSDGHCKAFDHEADGMIGSEGVGVVLIKAAEKAVSDKDNIYCFIRGIGANNDGNEKAGFYAPSVKGQRALIQSVMESSKTEAESIQLIEAHGTGTKIGDPIEFEALREAFELETHKKNFCALGSVKSNIGHTDAAAGIAGLIKLALCLSNNKIAPTVNFEKINPAINIENSPFYIANSKSSFRKEKLPVRAALSSFGIGGTNTHAVLEQFDKINQEYDGNDLLFLFSARNEKVLKKNIEDFLHFLTFTQSQPADIAYTLQVGRVPMTQRLAVVASSLNELSEKLNMYVDGQHNPQDAFWKNTETNSNALNLFTDDEDSLELIQTWMRKNKVSKLAELWVYGYDIDWESLYVKEKKRRVSLPTYSFDLKPYWIQKGNISKEGDVTKTLHPLLHQNISTFESQAFSSSFTQKEFFLKEHVIGKRKILPAMAYVEMALKAFQISFDDYEGNIKLSNIVWMNPIDEDSDLSNITTAFESTENGLEYKIINGNNKQEVHSLGSVEAFENLIERIDISILNTSKSWDEISKKEVYSFFTDHHVDYGKNFSGIQRVRIHDNMALAEIYLNEPESMESFLVHTGILDAALQGIMVMLNRKGLFEPSIPFALEEFVFLKPFDQKVYSLVEFVLDDGLVRKFNVKVFNENGEVSAILNGFSSRAIRGVISDNEMFYNPVWSRKEIAGEGKVSSQEEFILLYGIEKELPEYSNVLSITSDLKAGIAERYCSLVDELFHFVQQQIKEKKLDQYRFQFIYNNENAGSISNGMSAFFRSLKEEYPGLEYKCVGVETHQLDDLPSVISRNQIDLFNCEINYLDGIRHVKRIEEIPVSNSNTDFSWNSNGTYIITGGASGVGIVFAKSIVSSVENARVYLLGRSESNKEIKKSVSELNINQNKVYYLQCDVGSSEQVENIFNEHILYDKKYIDGIIHSAGVIKDNFLINKSDGEMEKVLHPKVQGSVNLVHAVQKVKTGFLLLCSSGASLFGKAGQTDYSTANAFLDEYAKYLNEKHDHIDKVISINWSLWKSGGMAVDEKTLSLIQKQTGMVAMSDEDGIQIFKRCMNLTYPQILALKGDVSKFKDITQNEQGEIVVELDDHNESSEMSFDGTEKKDVVDVICDLVSQNIKRPVEQIDIHTKMEEYGIDSIMAMNLTSDLEKIFGTLPKTLFFEYQNIASLSEYFMEEHEEKVRALNTSEKKQLRIEKDEKTVVSAKHLIHSKKVLVKKKEQPEENTPKEIAIIGIGMKFPDANNIWEYWENLKTGKNSVREIPQDRWNTEPYFDTERNVIGKMYSKWGGFIDGVENFDSLFFGITPLEAKYMEPQERLFLECVYKTIGDAGYTRDSLLSNDNTNLGQNIGVFAGVMYEEYQLYSAQEHLNGNYIPVNGIASSIANRVSYLMNFSGPSMTVDTMCSSSLTAMHFACQSIRSGDCELALAGGVNVSVHPNKYLLLSASNMGSSKGLCESFGEGGDGYVPGEGIGAVLLKSLEKAIEDKDNIYGVIKGSGVNHDSKTNGYTVPNPNAQSEVIQKAIERSKINPLAIGYIEAHGTGTELGDPIEFRGLNRAFKKLGQKPVSCALGSVKSNIGHLESAAGVAGVVKILLQLKHKTIVPSLHSGTLNKKIDFDDSPFHVPQELEEWKPYVHEGAEVERVAGISSFGAGGANAHVVIQEHKNVIDVEDDGEQVLLLSAKSEKSLKGLTKEYLEFSESSDWKNVSLKQIAFTLTNGREHFNHRLLITASNKMDLIEALHQYIKEESSPLYRYAKASIKTHEKINYSDLLENKQKDVKDKWLQGYSVQWDLKQVQKVSLPVYSFVGQRYWLPDFMTIDKSIPTVSKKENDEYDLILMNKTRSEVELKKLGSRAEQKFIVLLNMELKGQVDGTEVIEFNEESTNRAELFNKHMFNLMSWIQSGLLKNLRKETCLQVVVPGDIDNTTMAGISGLMKTLIQEHPILTYQLVVCSKATSLESTFLKELSESNVINDAVFLGAKREKEDWNEISDLDTLNEIPWLDNSVYLITGGAGGIGLLILKDIVDKVSGCKIVLTGRSALTEERRNSLLEYEVNNNTVMYSNVDVTDLKAVKNLVHKIETKYNRVDGVIHSAGVIKDGLIRNKDLPSMDTVLKVKTLGTYNLDEATISSDLKFFVCFSSGAAMGNIGQSDYAAANAFMDRFMDDRQRGVLAKKRSGKSVSINWPLWQDGGMQVDEKAKEQMVKSTGLVPLRTESALKALYYGVYSEETQLIVLEGEKEKILSSLIHKKQNKRKSLQENISVDKKQDIQQELIRGLKGFMSDITQMDVVDIDEEERFEEYGIDSIMINQLNGKLEVFYEDLSKTLFFERLSLVEVADYLAQEHYDESLKWCGVPQSAESKEENFVFENKVSPEKQNKALDSTDDNRDIAIIGLSGRYPGSNTLDEFWTLLESGKSGISEIPSDRWALEGFYEKNKKKAVQEGKSYSKWGGFLDGFADFDPLFFNLSPTEVLNTDPQERLFLESCWDVVEDAGYNKDIIEKYYQKNIGVFAGITRTGFDLHGPDYMGYDEKYHPHTSFSSLANRVSYLMDFHGPSIPIDTMCSSSLVAIHEACEYLLRDDCEMAIAGGVNLYLHKSSYIGLCAGQMLSEDGACKSFGQGGNGFVPGEGVGAVMLKRLSHAERDGDNIYAVIKGTGINHGGRVNGYTVPNPVAQEQLIKQVLKKSKIDARHISYVEAHGTGTELGDPIEVTGLKNAFGMHTEDKEYCALGSAKSNIGHLESAAGIAGLTKIVLQLKAKKIAPTLYVDELNPNINFSKTPFVVQKKLESWNKPRVNGEEIPRYAGLSSFGAGGANSHIILQEYENKIHVEDKWDLNVFILSAKDEFDLRQKAVDLLQYLKTIQAPLEAILRTLQFGRDSMDERLAFVANDIDDIETLLNQFISGGSNSTFYHFNVYDHKGIKKQFKSVEPSTLNASQVAEFWAKGAYIDWEYWNGRVGTKVSLPLYPYNREKFWFPEKKENSLSANYVRGINHPLLHENDSNTKRLRFKSEFTGEEIFFKDHVVYGLPTLPGVAYLEMAKKAIEKIMDSSDRVGLKNVVWAKPIQHSEKNPIIYTEIIISRSGIQSFEVYSWNNENQEKEIYCQGVFEFITESVENYPIGIDDALKPSLSPEELYGLYERGGIHYGKGHRSVVRIQSSGANEMLVTLTLPESVGMENYYIHPSILDGAFQSLLAMEIASQSTAAIPFALDSIQIFKPLEKNCRAIISKRTGTKQNLLKHDILVVNEKKECCVAIKGLTSRKIPITRDELKVFIPQLSEQIHRDDQTYNKNIVIPINFSNTDLKQLGNTFPDYTLYPVELMESSEDNGYTALTIELFNYLKSLNLGKTNGKVRCHVLFDVKNPMAKGLEGFLKTFELEYPNFKGKIVSSTSVDNTDGLLKVMNSSGAYMSFSDQKVFTYGWKEYSIEYDVNSIWSDDGVYIITGGMGGIGKLLIDDVVKHSRKTSIYLLGRKPVSDEFDELVQKYSSNSVELYYQQVDVSVETEIKSFIQYVFQKHGCINGVIHSAGTIRDNFILRKDIQEIKDVFRAKVQGSWNVHTALLGVPIDFLVFFSSAAAITGNVGQVDYAAANGFMDWLAEHRTEIEGSLGHTLSLNWPLWKSEGMQNSSASADSIFSLMDGEEAFRVLHHAVHEKLNRVLCVKGDWDKIMRDNFFQKLGILRDNHMSGDEEILNDLIDLLEEGDFEDDELEVLLTAIDE